MDGTLAWVVVIVVAALLVAAIAWAASTVVRSRRLRQQFGPEYDRTVRRTGGDRRQAESELGTRVSRHRELELRPLSPTARAGYLRRWDQTQAEFVDEPGTAVGHAQVLVDELMSERGYPVGEELEERVDLVSVDHPDVVEHYRIAQRLHEESAAVGDPAVATEERRQALVHYRALFTDLLETDGYQETGPDGPDDEVTGEEPETIERERRIG